MPTSKTDPDTSSNCADETPDAAPADVDALMSTPARRPPGPWSRHDGDKPAPPERPQT